LCRMGARSMLAGMGLPEVLGLISERALPTRPSTACSSAIRRAGMFALARPMARSELRAFNFQLLRQRKSRQRHCQQRATAVLDCKTRRRPVRRTSSAGGCRRAHLAPSAAQRLMPGVGLVPGPLLKDVDLPHLQRRAAHANRDLQCEHERVARPGVAFAVGWLQRQCPRHRADSKIPAACAAQHRLM